MEIQINHLFYVTNAYNFAMNSVYKLSVKKNCTCVTLEKPTKFIRRHLLYWTNYQHYAGDIYFM